MRISESLGNVARATIAALIASLMIVVSPVIDSQPAQANVSKTWENYYSSSPSLIASFTVDPNSPFFLRLPAAGIGGGSQIDFMYEDSNENFVIISSSAFVADTTTSSPEYIINASEMPDKGITKLYISVSGSVSKLGVASRGGNPQTWKDSLKGIHSWGNLGLTEINHSVKGADIEIVPKNIPTGVTYLFDMFREQTIFDYDISDWDTSNITDMSGMFYDATSFNKPLDAWNVSNVTDMTEMFKNSSFNQDLNSWNVSRVDNFYQMFMDSSFNGSIGNWDVSGATDMSGMFSGNSVFNQDISRWNVSRVDNFDQMFMDSSFNGSIGNWDVSGATDMSGMFSGNSVFNQDISRWNTSNVEYFDLMFYEATSFNQHLPNRNVGLYDAWDVSAAISAGQMFASASAFTGNLSGWDWTQNTYFEGMFENSGFNGLVYDWTFTTSPNAEIDFQNIFKDSAFNGDVGNWSVSRVTNMQSMFENTPFDQSLEQWNFAAVTNLNNMLGGTSLSCENYDLFTQASGLTLNENDSTSPFFSGYDRTPCPKTWSNFYSSSPALVLEFQVDELNIDNYFEVQIPISGNVSGNVHVYNSDYQSVVTPAPLKSVSASENVIVTSSGLAAGDIVFIEVSGSATTLGGSSNNPDSWNQQLVGIHSWGALPWTNISYSLNGATISAVPSNIPAAVTSLGNMFADQTTFNQDISMWDVSNVEEMWTMFSGATSFNQPLNTWDVSKVYTMDTMFADATSFDQPLNNWDVSNVTGMAYIFAGATSFNGDITNWTVSNITSADSMFWKAANFNQDIGNWDVSNVTEMLNMFAGATSFSQDISDWDVSKVTDMESMFEGASNFNQDINDWDVSKVDNMNRMFLDASSFNQDLSDWNISSMQRNRFDGMTDMFDGTALSCSNYDAFLNGIVTSAPSKAIPLGGAKYTEASADARQALIDKGWTLNDSPCPVVQQNQTGVGGSQTPTSQMPALAPMPTIDQSVITVAPGSEIRVSGENFDLIVSAEIAGQSVSISAKTGESMTLTIPALEPGEHTLDLVTTNGRLSVQGFVRVLDSGVSGESLDSVISSLNPWSSWLNKQALAQVEAAVQGQTVVTCIAYNDRPGLAARKKALSRAMHACRVAEQLGIETRVFVYGKAPQLADTVKILFR